MRQFSLMTTALAAVLAFTGCKRGSEGAKASDAKAAPTIALLLPESKTTRYESFDRPLFEAKVKSLYPECKLLYFNADQDAAKQQSQIEAALTQGAKVLVLDAVDSAAVAPSVTRAKQRNVPVIAYDRLISGVGYEAYVSFDNVKVGQVQGEALLKALEEKGTLKKGKIVVINGAPTDPSAGDYKKGAHLAFDGKVTIGKEYDTPDWSPDKAQQEMEQAIVALGKNQISGVYCANDGTAGGAIAAMKRAGFKQMPPITGQDAELAAIQRIVTGEQYMTIYLNIRTQAETAADLAVKLVKGEALQAPTAVDNGTAKIPAWLLDPIPVTRDQIKATIIKDGFYKVEEICIPSIEGACVKAGIK